MTRKNLTALSSVRLQQSLLTGPQSVDDLVLISGLSKGVVSRYVRALSREKLVHVGEWGRDPRGYPTIRRYTWGDALNAKRPYKYESDAERMRVSRASAKGART